MLNNAAHYHEELGDFTRAIELYTRALRSKLRVSCEVGTALNNLSVCYAKQSLDQSTSLKCAELAERALRLQRDCPLN